MAGSQPVSPPRLVNQLMFWRAIRKRSIFQAATWPSAAKHSNHLTDSIHNTVKPETTWTCAGDFNRQANGLPSRREHLSGIIVGKGHVRTCGNRPDMARRKRSCDLSIRTNSTDAAMENGAA